MHPHEGIFRAYVEGEVSDSDRQKVDAHMKDCGDCRDLLSFMRDFSDAAKDFAADDIAQDEPHARNEVIIAYEEGKLDKETALHLRSHMLFCDRCAETYYLLKRMRAPSWTTVVIETVRSAKETLLRAVEITGMGELVPLSVAVTRRRGEQEQAQPKLEIALYVTDAHDEAELVIHVESGHARGVSIRVLLRGDPPKPGWKAKLLDAENKVLASIPLTNQEQELHPALSTGIFEVQVLKGEDLEVLAMCQLKIQPPHAGIVSTP
jgi:hypothetical protein